MTASSDGADENDAAAGLLVSDTLRSHTRPGSNSVGTIVPEVSLCLNAGAMGRIDSESETMIPVFFDSKSTHPASSVGDVAPTLRAMNHAKSHANAGGQVAVAFAATDYKDGAFQATDAAGPLTTSADRTRAAPITTGFHGVRRLTPVECERLQGFPDNYTLVDVRGKPAADGPRYKAIGNSMATNVMAWIGRRIDRAVIRLGDAA